MEAFGRFSISGSGILFPIEISKEMKFSIGHYPSVPLSLLRGERNSLISASVISTPARITDIFAVRGQSEVGPSVVKSVYVLVIDLLTWPFASHPKPCQAMRKVVVPINTDFDTALAARAGFLANFDSNRNPFLPAKDARVGAVIQNLS